MCQTLLILTLNCYKCYKTNRRIKGEIVNPVFVILVILGAILLWFLLSFVFYPLGRFLYLLWKDATDEMNREDKSKRRKK